MRLQCRPEYWILPELFNILIFLLMFKIWRKIIFRRRWLFSVCVCVTIGFRFPRELKNESFQKVCFETNTSFKKRIEITFLKAFELLFTRFLYFYYTTNIGTRILPVGICKIYQKKVVFYFYFFFTLLDWLKLFW